MKASELRNLVEDMQPMGQPKPPEKELQVRTSDALCSLQACVDARYLLLLTTVCILFRVVLLSLQACVDEILKANDVNANGGLSFEEFAVGYDRLLDQVDALHKSQRRKVMETQVGSPPLLYHRRVHGLCAASVLHKVRPSLRYIH